MPRRLKSDEKFEGTVSVDDIGSTYKKMSQVEHVLNLPDTYIGSVERAEIELWLVDKETGKLQKKMVKIVPGFYKIFDEILVNAYDQYVRLKGDDSRRQVKEIHVEITPEYVSVMNDGEGIDVEVHPEYDVYVPELIFGNMLTSANYHKTSKITGGKNGLGSKAIHPDTIVPTYDGKFKRAGDIKLDDKLIGDDGTPRNILEIWRGTGVSYMISQKNGMSYEVNEQHILTVMFPDHKVIYWDEKSDTWNIQYWNKYLREISIFSMKVDKSYMEDFGVMIDDNNIFDISVRDFIRLRKTSELSIVGIRGGMPQWPEKSLDILPYEMGNQLKESIPRDYLCNSYDNREELLRGILNSKKIEKRKNGSIFIEIEKLGDLYNDFIFLVRSLGYMVHRYENNAIFLEKNVGHCGDIICKKVGEGPYIGFALDNNNHFVMEDYTVTHNCTNIFSKKFVVETVDEARRRYYKQEFRENMSEKDEPLVEKYTKKPFTKITYYPDYERFHMDGLDDETEGLLMKRVFDMTATTDKTLSVFLNGKKIELKDFEKYVDLYIGPKTETKRVYESINDRWEVAVCMSPDDKFEQISFVNGIYTWKGGKHVEALAQTISTKLAKYVESKGKKKISLKPSIIRDNMWIFARSIIEDPSFDSQTKEYLTTPPAKFGSKFQISDKFIEKVSKLGIVERAIKFSEYKDSKILTKTDGKKTNMIRGIPKLDDANWAGTPKSSQCTLILTEGDSAKAFAIAGLSVIGRDKYGVFPLRGKLLNVRDAADDKVSKNEEIKNLKLILGLQQGKVYEDLSDLRYGSIMILTDADVDGSHIKGLLINLFHNFWPSLLKQSGFIKSMMTPIVKAKKKGEVKVFYTLTDYENWKNSPNTTGYDIKYYKGLGTSTSQEAKEYFTDLDNSEIRYLWNEQSPVDETVNLAFNKDRADDRKQWLGGYDRNSIIEQNQKDVPIEDFINKDLIHFSKYDCERSVPSLVDGFKPSQRKVIYGAMLRNLKKSIKVAQLAAYVAEKSAYHHGEQSLNECIVGLAQDFVGSNNMNYLVPEGNFGCLSPDTEVLMWDGSVKQAQDIAINDELVGDDGEKRLVLEVTSGIDDMYRITNEDGLTMEVNSQHILTLYYTRQFLVNKEKEDSSWYFHYCDGKSCEKISVSEYSLIIREKRKLEEIYGTSNVIDIKLNDFMKLSEDDKKNFYQISNCCCINWDKKPVPEDPYIIGSKNADIPEIYVCNDKDTRMQLLAGFIDNCGEVRSNCYEIRQTETNVSILRRIANSLGFSTKISETNSLLIFGENVCLIPVECITKNNFTEFKIEHIGKDKFNGFQLDKNERFLLANYTVTHNSRLVGGKDHASPRYIFTKMSEFCGLVFNQNDSALLDYLDDDGDQIEPEFYVPIIPNILVNGCKGIGTGFSTTVPSYNPLDIISNLRRKMRDEEMIEMKPWFRGFVGKIEKVNNKYVSKGLYRVLDTSKVEIYELPIGMWTDKYKEHLEELMNVEKEGRKKKKQILLKYESQYTESKVKFILHFDKNELSRMLNKGLFEKEMKLIDSGNTNTSNMHLFNELGQIRKYDMPEDIISEFYEIRKRYYERRKEYLENRLKRDLNVISARVRFILAILEEDIILKGKDEEELDAELEKKGYPKFTKGKLEFDPKAENENPSFDYLVSMPIRSMTRKRLEELMKQKDDKTMAYEKLLKLSIYDLWSSDLDELEANYRKHLVEYDKMVSFGGDGVATSSGKKRVVRKRVVKSA